MDEGRSNDPAEVPLQGWRKIADYFGRDICSRIPDHTTGGYVETACKRSGN